MKTPTPKPVFRTFAAIAALSLAGAAFAAPAHALPSKVVTLKPTQHPQLIDNAGNANDVIRVFNVQGLTWTVDGGEPINFGGAGAKDVPVTTAVDVVAAVVESDPLATYTLAGGPTTWKMAAPTNSAITKTAADKVVPSWFDAPGTKSDSVTLPKIPGVTWTVTDGTAVKNYTEKDFGTKTSLTVKLPKGTEVVDYTFDSDLIEGTPVKPTKGTTTADTITYAQDAVTDSLAVGANPLDKWKGFGKGAAVETVRVSGLAGVKYQVGTNKAVAVKGIKDLPVDPSDLDANGEVDVVITPASASYKLAAGEKQTVTMDFTDGDESEVTLAPESADTAVVATDLGGAPSDTLVMPAISHMTWWVGQKNAKTGKIDYRAQKVGKDGNVTYKVKHTKPAKGATGALPKANVFVKPVADRGYVLNTTGWTPPAAGWEFSQENVIVAADKLGVPGTNNVTLTLDPGVTQWTIAETTKKADVKDKVKRTTYKAADLKKLGATAIIVPTKVAGADETVSVTVTPKFAKFYQAAPTAP